MKTKKQSVKKPAKKLVKTTKPDHGDEKLVDWAKKVTNHKISGFVIAANMDAGVKGFCISEMNKGDVLRILLSLIEEITNLKGTSKK